MIVDPKEHSVSDKNMVEYTRSDVQMERIEEVRAPFSNIAARHFVEHVDEAGWSKLDMERARDLLLAAAEIVEDIERVTLDATADHRGLIATILATGRPRARPSSSMPTIEQLLEEYSEPYTREQFEADRARLTVRLCEKHGIAESEINALLREHRYEHSGEDPEEEYMEVMTMGRHAGWLV